MLAKALPFKFYLFIYFFYEKMRKFCTAKAHSKNISILDSVCCRKHEESLTKTLLSW